MYEALFKLVSSTRSSTTYSIIFFFLAEANMAKKLDIMFSIGEDVINDGNQSSENAFSRWL